MAQASLAGTLQMASAHSCHLPDKHAAWALPSSSWWAWCSWPVSPASIQEQWALCVRCGPISTYAHSAWGAEVHASHIHAECNKELVHACCWTLRSLLTASCSSQSRSHPATGSLPSAILASASLTCPPMTASRAAAGCQGCGLQVLHQACFQLQVQGCLQIADHSSCSVRGTSGVWAV